MSNNSNIERLVSMRPLFYSVRARIRPNHLKERTKNGSHIDHRSQQGHRFRNALVLGRAGHTVYATMREPDRSPTFGIDARPRVQRKQQS